MTFTTQGIVLLKRDFREHDRIYTIYTREQGKIEALGRATRRITSKLASHLEPPSVVDCMIAEGKIFNYVAGVRRLQSFRNIYADFDLAEDFSRVAAIFDKEVKLAQKDDALYSLLTNFLENLNGKTASTINLTDTFLTRLTGWTSYGIMPNR